MSIEAMKQALEALESATPKYTRQRADQKTLGGALDYWKLEQHQRLKAITSLHQAIAEAEQLDKLLVHQPMLDLWQRYCDKKQEVDDLKEKLAEAEKQEPVGEILLTNGDYKEASWKNGKLPPVGAKLYTHPQPKREWVGLTDEEIDECDWGQSERDHARAIEAKLKDKNGF